MAAFMHLTALYLHQSNCHLARITNSLSCRSLQFWDPYYQAMQTSIDVVGNASLRIQHFNTRILHYRTRNFGRRNMEATIGLLFYSRYESSGENLDRFTLVPSLRLYF